MNSPVIVRARKKDAKIVASLHKEGIPTGFISSLPLWLVASLYEVIIDKGIVFLLVKDEKVIGFISAALNTKSIYKEFVKRKFFHLFPLMFLKIFSLKFIKKVFETLSAPSKTETEDKLELPELLSIVIDKNVQAKGYGKILLDELEKEFKSLGVAKYKVVAGEKLEAANKFYQKNGFGLYKKTEIHKGDISNVYVKVL